MRNSAKLIIFEFLTVVDNFVTLRRFTRNPSWCNYIWCLSLLIEGSLNTLCSFEKPKGDFDELIKAFTVKCQRTDHTLDAHFTDISTVHNFEQPLAGLSHWLERLTREEKDSSKYRTSRWQRGKEIITFKSSSMMKFHTGEITSKREKYGFRRAQRQDTI